MAGFTSSGTMDRFPTSDYTIHGESQGSSCPAGQQIIRSRPKPGGLIGQRLITCATPVVKLAAPIIQPAPVFKPVVNVSVPTQVTTDTQVSPIISPIIDSPNAGFTATTAQETGGASQQPGGFDSSIFLEMMRIQAEKDAESARLNNERDRLAAESRGAALFDMESRLKQFVIDSTKTAPIDPAIAKPAAAVQPAFPVFQPTQRPQIQKKPPINWLAIASAGLGAIGLIILSQRV